MRKTPAAVILLEWRKKRKSCTEGSSESEPEADHLDFNLIPEESYDDPPAADNFELLDFGNRERGKVMCVKV